MVCAPKGNPGSNFKEMVSSSYQESSPQGLGLHQENKIKNSKGSASNALLLPPDDQEALVQAGFTPPPQNAEEILASTLASFINNEGGIIGSLQAKPKMTTFQQPHWISGLQALVTNTGDKNLVELSNIPPSLRILQLDPTGAQALKSQLQTQGIKADILICTPSINNFSSPFVNTNILEPTKSTPPSLPWNKVAQTLATSVAALSKESPKSSLTLQTPGVLAGTKASVNYNGQSGKVQVKFEQVSTSFNTALSSPQDSKAFINASSKQGVDVDLNPNKIVVPTTAPIDTRQSNAASNHYFAFDPKTNKPVPHTKIENLDSKDYLKKRGNSVSGVGSGQANPTNTNNILSAETNPAATSADGNNIKVIQELTSYLVQQISAVTNSGRSEIAITLKHPPGFEGVQVLITEYNSSQKELNIQFSNLSNQAQALLKNHESSLRATLHDKGFTLHNLMTTHQVDTSSAFINLSESQQQHEGQPNTNQGNDSQGGQQNPNPKERLFAESTDTEEEY